MVDTEDINDPTRGERNQRLNAALFALGAVICSPKELNLEDAVKASCFLSFCYVEQKATRVLSANLLFRLWQRYPQVLHAEEAVEWCTFAFFYYPKLEYFRPEALQCLLRLMEMPTTPKQLPPSIVEYVSLDPLKPSVMEQLANALFRNEQVTQVHPMLHPVWKDLFDLMLKRCGAGESLQEHLTTFVHTVIVPYRRGSSDVPRRTLFQNLVMELGQIAVQSADHRERTQVLEMANKAAGYGKKISAKASTLAELKQLPVSALQEKVMDLISQYKSLKDSDLASHSNRKWILRELRNSLLVPVREGISCDYVNDAAFFFLRYGFFPPKSAGDQKMANHCIYLFAELFSFTLKGDLMRPKSTVNPREIMTLYLEKEEKGLTRYKTAVDHKKFKKARNLIVDALENSAKRSVLFYDKEDIEILLVLLFLMLSVDDASNADATLIATSVVPDLTHFFLNGSLDSLDMLYDIMMTIILRKTSPLHVLPLQSCIRRIAIGYMQKFAKFIRSEETVTILLAPLKEAFNTDSRELARLDRVKNGENEDSDSEEDDQDQRADPDEVADDESQGDSESSSDNDDDEDDESTSAGSEQSAEGGGL
ncbi:hypothetical protein AGDE_14864 [Angomonas deanei]|uniref:DNA polymerase phi, putative n=1 Tax=Angomonas deanei TaxID=59799 RepID=A0A7G2CEZ0_9TRYP|nr:hypothetical protein AGDE_14864 [Angomonas deanei]CAD2218336.1 DNA polymerase phi, putative [Angomonas deanei]|eukprot:EPY20087.1 hypothetical protein AGDE_14864 [Angomonas deanei]